MCCQAAHAGDADSDIIVASENECLIHHADSRTYAIEEKDKYHVGVEEVHPLLVCTGMTF